MLSEIIRSGKTVEIRPIVGDPAIARDPIIRGVALFPTTRFSGRGALRQENGNCGAGTGSTVYVPTSKSKLVFGNYDLRGAEQIPPLIIVLGHELFGHAYSGLRGAEDRRRQDRAGRAMFPGSHDHAIGIENIVRLELMATNTIARMPLRGTNETDPVQRGESRWKLRGNRNWMNRPPRASDIGLDD
jgi:hypothetical protein